MNPSVLGLDILLPFLERSTVQLGKRLFDQLDGLIDFVKLDLLVELRHWVLRLEFSHSVELGVDLVEMLQVQQDLLRFHVEVFLVLLILDPFDIDESHHLSLHKDDLPAVLVEAR